MQVLKSVCNTCTGWYLVAVPVPKVNPFPPIPSFSCLVSECVCVCVCVCVCCYLFHHFQFSLNMSLSNYTVYRWKGGCPDHEEANNWGGIWCLKAYPVLLWCQHLHHRHRPPAEARLWVPWVVVVTATWSSTTRPQRAWPWGSQLLAPITKNGHEAKQQAHESQQAEKEMIFVSFALSFSPLPPPPFPPPPHPLTLQPHSSEWNVVLLYILNETYEWKHVDECKSLEYRKCEPNIFLCHAWVSLSEHTCANLFIGLSVSIFSLSLSFSLSFSLYTWVVRWN